MAHRNEVNNYMYIFPYQNKTLWMDSYFELSSLYERSELPPETNAKSPSPVIQGWARF